MPPSFSLNALLTISTLPLLATPREITFPPSLANQLPLNDLWAQTPGVPGHGNPFAGLTTFANLPFVQCLADVPNEKVQRFDVAFLGAPFDTVCCFINILSCEQTRTVFFCVWVPAIMFRRRHVACGLSRV